METGGAGLGGIGLGCAAGIGLGAGFLIILVFAATGVFLAAVFNGALALGFLIFAAGALFFFAGWVVMPLPIWPP